LCKTLTAFLKGIFIILINQSSYHYLYYMSRDYPVVDARDYPVTPTHVPRPPLYLRPRFLTCSCSLSNVLNHYESMYLARSIASNQAYSQLLSRFRDTTFDPKLHLADLRLLVAEHAFLRLMRVGTGAAGCR